jgi:hypothetical protein
MHGPCTVPCVLGGWQQQQPTTATLDMPLPCALKSRMRPTKRQVAVLGRAQTISRAEHTGMCAVARGIHRSFRSAIRLRTEGARSAGVDWQSYPITVRDARKACRLRATRRRLRATLGRRQGTRKLRATPRRLQIHCVRPDSRPQKIPLIADGFNSFQPTVDKNKAWVEEAAHQQLGV